MRRDRALDTYERVLQQHVDELRARRPPPRTSRSKTRSPQRVAELRARIDENTRSVAAEQAELRGLADAQAAGRSARSPRPSATSCRRIRSRRRRRGRAPKETPMFARLGRLFRAWMGFFISVGENPEVMLQDAIEEMRMTMPKLNSVLVATRATVIRLEEERDALQRQDRTSPRRSRRRCATARPPRAAWPRKTRSSCSSCARTWPAPRSSWPPRRRRTRARRCRSTRSRPS